MKEGRSLGDFIHGMNPGYLLAVFTYFFWGLLPFYFNSLHGLSAIEILVHRIFWSFLFIGFLLFLLKKYSLFFKIFFSKKILCLLSLSSLFLAANWLIFIYATETNQVIQLSLGYYINPLLNMLLGFMFFKESVGRLAKVAILLACIGLVLQLFSIASFPVLAVSIAIAFSLYGAIRKGIAVDPLCGVFFETCVLIGPSLFWLFYFSEMQSLAMMKIDMYWVFMLMLAGPITSIPLITFSLAVKKISYVFMGFFQYITPTLLFIIAIFVYDEHWDYLDVATFVLIWLGISLVLLEIYRGYSRD